MPDLLTTQSFLLENSVTNNNGTVKESSVRSRNTRKKAGYNVVKQELAIAKQQLTQALNQMQQQSTQITQLQTQTQRSQATSENQERLLASYKQSLTTYLNTHKRPDWEFGGYGGYCDGGMYGVELQRNYSVSSAISFLYLSGSKKGGLVGFKILF